MTNRATITELAAEFHIARSVALRYLTDAGIPRDAKKTYDFDDAAEAIQRRKDEATTDGNRLAGRAGGLGDDAARLKLAHSKAESEQMRARKLRLDVEAKEGALIDRRAVEKTGHFVIAAARTAFLSIGAKVAPRLAGMTDERQIARIIEDEARIALGPLADIDQFLEAVV